MSLYGLIIDRVVVVLMPVGGVQQKDGERHVEDDVLQSKDDGGAFCGEERIARGGEEGRKWGRGPPKLLTNKVENKKDGKRTLSLYYHTMGIVVVTLSVFFTTTTRIARECQDSSWLRSWGAYLVHFGLTMW